MPQFYDFYDPVSESSEKARYKRSLKIREALSDEKFADKVKRIAKNDALKEENKSITKHRLFAGGIIGVAAIFGAVALYGFNSSNLGVASVFTMSNVVPLSLTCAIIDSCIRNGWKHEYGYRKSDDFREPYQEEIERVADKLVL